MCQWGDHSFNCWPQAHTFKHADLSNCMFLVLIRSQLHTAGESRTVESLKKLLSDWREAGAVHADAKFFGNVINDPLIDTDNDAHVIDVLPPPELHLMLGVVNTLYAGIIFNVRSIELFIFH